MVAVGDCARWAGVRHEHWNAAQDQARVAAHTLLGRTAPPAPVPSVWSGLLGVRLQVAGDLTGATPHAVDGADPTDPATWTDPHPSVCAVAVRDGVVRGVLAVDAGRSFGRRRRRIGHPSQ